MSRSDLIILSGFPLAYLFGAIFFGSVLMLLLFGVFYFMFLDMLTWSARAERDLTKMEAGNVA